MGEAKLNADQFSFYLIVVAPFTLVGIYVATRNNEPSSITSGVMLYVFGLLMLCASVNNPLGDYIESSMEVGLLGVILIVIGVVVLAFSKDLELDILGLLVIAAGTLLVYESGLGNPVIRGILQEIQTAQVI